MPSALLLDFGGVLLLTPFELCRAAEREAGLTPGALDWHGPFDSERDPQWQRMQAGAMTEREYWAERAVEFGRLVPLPTTDPLEATKAMFRPFYELPESDLIRPQGLALVRHARAHGVPIGILTNDMLAFHGQAWCDRMTVLSEVDAVVDGSTTGVLKPSAEAYELAATALGLPPGEIVFVDDQPGNVGGAQAVGMSAVLFDVTAPDESFAVAAGLVGLSG